MSRYNARTLLETEATVRETKTEGYLDELEIPVGTIGNSVQQAFERAINTAHRYEHATLQGEHLFLALAQLEWPLFVDTLRSVSLNPHVVLAGVEQEMRKQPAAMAPLRPSPELKLICRMATHYASRAGRQGVEAADVFVALLSERHGAVASVFRTCGVDPEAAIPGIRVRARVAALGAPSPKRYELSPALAQVATNLNLLAREDKLAPVFGRDGELQQVLEVLCHRERSNSVMLLGEPGVGKTAIVEALARRLELDPDSVPARLRDAQILSLNLTAMVAGTTLRGMFEERIQKVIAEVRQRPELILFIDEAHTMVGAGSALGAPADAASVLKSVLARGEIRVIAATTLSEYKQHIQDDEALARRFRCVQVAEPSIEETRRILYQLRPRLERNYAVTILDDAIEAALELSPRYVRHLRLPDKVVSWLDTAAVRAEMNRRWEVSADDIVSAVSTATEMPKDMVARDVTGRFADLEARLSRRVVGQSEAVSAVARRLLLNKGPLKDGFDRPDGVLLFLGPTGVGKTELAKALAEALFGDEKRMVRIDMSEYQDSQVGIDKLIGMPRGVAGSGRGGTLTNQLADNPHTVLLLDEVEKASPHVLNLFLQAFDEGWLTDGRGKRVYLSDALVIMTSNVGSEHFRKLASPLGFLAADASAAQVRADIRSEVARRFTPEFLNRIDQVVIFDPLTPQDAHAIAGHYLGALARTLDQHGKLLTITDEAMTQLVAAGHSAADGARFLKRVIDERVKLPISRTWRDSQRFHVAVEDGEVAVNGHTAVAADEDEPFTCVA